MVSNAWGQICAISTRDKHQYAHRQSPQVTRLTTIGICKHSPLIATTHCHCSANWLINCGNKYATATCNRVNDCLPAVNWRGHWASAELQSWLPIANCRPMVSSKPALARAHLSQPCQLPQQKRVQRMMWLCHGGENGRWRLIAIIIGRKSQHPPHTTSASADRFRTHFLTTPGANCSGAT